MKDPATMDKENRQLRAILRRVLDLAECSDDCALGKIRDEIEMVLKSQDLRTTNSGFNNPEMLAKVAATRGAKRESFLKAHGPALRELKGQGHSFGAIAEILNDRGVPAPGGGRWARGSVKYQIDNLPED